MCSSDLANPAMKKDTDHLVYMKHRKREMEASILHYDEQNKEIENGLVKKDEADAIAYRELTAILDMKK